MPRHRRAWLANRTGIRIQNGSRLPGFYVLFWDRSGPRPIYRSHQFQTLAQATAWRDTFNARQELVRLRQIAPDTLAPIAISQAVGEFRIATRRLSASTQSSYITAINGLVPHVAGLHVRDVTPQHIEARIAAFPAPTTDATVAKHLRGLHRFFSWCVDRRYCSSNPVDGVTTTLRTASFERSRQPIGDRQLAALAAACDTEDRRIAVWLAITTGLDRAVIAALSSDHVDLHSLTIRVVRPKSGKLIAVPLHPRLAALLEPRLRAAPPGSAVLSAILRPRWAQEDWFHAVRDRAGCPTLLFRDLRAVFATRAQDLAGLSPTQTQRLAGHASPQTTARHYRIPDPAARQALDRLPIPGLPPPEESTPSKPARADATRRRRAGSRPAARRRSSD